jgi:hypothetical protein
MGEILPSQLWRQFNAPFAQLDLTDFDYVFLTLSRLDLTSVSLSFSSVRFTLEICNFLFLFNIFDFSIIKFSSVLLRYHYIHFDFLLPFLSSKGEL